MELLSVSLSFLQVTRGTCKGLLVEVPVLPRLQAIAVEEEVEGLPVVVDLVTVVHDVVHCREQTSDEQHEEGCLGTHSLSLRPGGPAQEIVVTLLPGIFRSCFF